MSEEKVFFKKNSTEDGKSKRNVGCELVGWLSRRSGGDGSGKKGAGKKNHVCLKHHDSQLGSLIG